MLSQQTITLMPDSVGSVAAMEAFFRSLVFVDGVNFHVDDDFHNYDAATPMEADALNIIMAELVAKFGDESYAAGVRVFREYLETTERV